MPKYVCIPTDSRDGNGVKFDTESGAFKYASAAWALGIRAIVLKSATREVIYRNYPTVVLDRPLWT